MKAPRNLLTSFGILLTIAGAVLITLATFEWRGVLGWTSIVAGLVILTSSFTRTERLFT